MNGNRPLSFWETISFYGEDFRKYLEVASGRQDGATIFGYHVADPSAYGVVEFAPDRRVLSLEEKPKPQNPTTRFPDSIFTITGQRTLLGV